MSQVENTADHVGGFRLLLRHLNPVYLWRTYFYGFILTLLVSAFLLVLLWNHVVVPIEPGHEGVYWSRFWGGTQSFSLEEGTAFKLPWDRIYIYDVRMHRRNGTVPLLSVDGLLIMIDWEARYYPNKASLPLLHKTIGPDYEEKIVTPEVVSALRRILGNYRADEIYAADEAGLLLRIADLVKQELEENPIVFDDVLITKLLLPPAIAEAIEQKLVFEQRLQAYDFRLPAEDKERQRREIEATGIQKFQEVSGIPILKWRGIEATLELSRSDNTKIVIIGPDSESLPVILNADDRKGD